MVMILLGAVLYSAAYTNGQFFGFKFWALNPDSNKQKLNIIQKLLLNESK